MAFDDTSDPASTDPASTDPTYTVGELAALAHVSVRTLHHYDEIGLLSPGSRTPAGYRLYRGSDVTRLQQIRFYRELEFSLDVIAAMLGDPTVDVGDHLRRQHALLRERIDHHQGLLAAIEKEIQARDLGVVLTPQERFEIFGPDVEKHFGGEYAAEAEQRWGATAPWQRTRRKASAYTADDWRQIKAESEAIEVAFAQALAAGVAAESAVAMDLAQEHRAHIGRWFYDCPYQVHAGLGELYVSDDRFRGYYEDIAAGLARFLHDAIVSNAARHTGVDTDPPRRTGRE